MEDKELAVVITGCDSGFGKELCFRLAAEGFHVFAGILKPSSNDLFRGEPLIQPLVLDVTNEKDAQNAYELVIKWTKEGDKQRCLHSLVNNAGLGRFGLIDWNTMDDYEICMNVNCYGQIRMVKAFLPLLKKQAIQGSYGQSQIVNMVSCAGMASAGGLGGAPYEVSKHAAEAFTDSLRLELKTFGIKVVAVNPSFHSTDMVDSTDELLDPDNMWNRLTSAHHEEYGKTFVDKFCIHARTMIRSATWDFKVVIDVMVDIIQSSSPSAQVVIGMDFRYGLAGVRMFPQWFRHCLTLIALPYLEPAAMASSKPLSETKRK
jgi:NAD(P)-dependent dehydrogenase (short-subunit alcohol dehydrogenase family)